MTRFPTQITTFMSITSNWFTPMMFHQVIPETQRSDLIGVEERRLLYVHYQHQS